MKRILFATLVSAACGANAVQHAIDLGHPGALDRIQRENPARYEKILGIMHVAGAEVSCETLPQMLKVQYDVSTAHCHGAMILTSFPAKRHLTFTIEDTSYRVNVVLRGSPGKLQPLVLTRP